MSDAPNLAGNLRAYINGFSDNMREVLEKSDFENTITKLDEAGLLFLILEKFKTIDLHPDKVSNHEMGYIFEELIRKFNEALNENPGALFKDRAQFEKILNDAAKSCSVRLSPPIRKDGAIGKVGYEINFNRYFYKYQPPRPLPIIEADIRTLEKEIMGMLREVAG